MVHYVSLITYPETRSRRPVPAHWAIIVTRSRDDLAGQVYHAIGNPFQGYDFELKPKYNLSNTFREYTKTLLGQIDDAWLPQLAVIATSLGRLPPSQQPLDPFAVSPCSYSPGIRVDLLNR